MLFYIFIHFFDEFPSSKQNGSRLDAAFCLPMSHKKEARLKREIKHGIFMQHPINTDSDVT